MTLSCVLFILALTESLRCGISRIVDVMCDLPNGLYTRSNLINLDDLEILFPLSKDLLLCKSEVMADLGCEKHSKSICVPGSNLLAALTDFSAGLRSRTIGSHSRPIKRSL